jgi:hypothetical protein
MGEPFLNQLSLIDSRSTILEARTIPGMHFLGKMG